jgi:hypothetical protein
MYVSYSITTEAAQQRQRDMMAGANRERLARQALAENRSAQPSVVRPRRRTRQLVRQLRMLAQS